MARAKANNICTVRVEKANMMERIEAHVAVAVVHADDQLLEEPAGAVFRQSATVAVDVLKQGASRCVLQHHAQVVPGEEYLRKVKLSK